MLPAIRFIEERVYLESGSGALLSTWKYFVNEVLIGNVEMI